MNRFINALLLFLLFPTMAVAIFVGFDLPVEFLRTTGGQMTYSTIIFLILGVLILMVNLRRSIRRWMGMILVFKTAKFKWNKPVGKDRTQRIIVYTLLESMVFGLLPCWCHNKGCDHGRSGCTIGLFLWLTQGEYPPRFALF